MGTSGSDLEIGTDQWLVRTGGRLTLMQALKIAAQGFHQTMQSRLSRKSQHGESQASEQLGRVNKARDHLTPVLQVLRDRVIDRQGQAMLNHSCRTYLLGAALLSDEEFRRIDFTLAAVAALAHDDGLVNPSTHGNCFTADSASEANFLLEKLGMPEKSFEPARAAVIAHFQPVLPIGSGPEARLLALGASADVTGIGLSKIHPLVIFEVWREWPELGFLADLKPLLKGEISRAPRTRPGVLSIAGMPYLLRKPMSGERRS